MSLIVTFVSKHVILQQRPIGLTDSAWELTSMVRLSDLPNYEREHLLSKNLPPLGPAVWTKAEADLSELRIALITTAGLHYRDAQAFAFTDSTLSLIHI